MKPISEIIRAHAALLDSQRKQAVPIRVRASRATLRKYFKNEKRGAPLFCGEHQLIPVRDAVELTPNQVDFIAASPEQVAA